MHFSVVDRDPTLYIHALVKLLKYPTIFIRNKVGLRLG